MTTRWILIALFSVTIAGCVRQATAPSSIPTVPSSPAGEAALAGYDPDDLDPAVPACEDFYRHAVGGFLDRNPVPPAFSTWGQFTILADRNREILREIAEQAVARPDAGAVHRLVGDFYAACMNEEEIERLGAAPIEPELERIARIDSRASLQDAIARLHATGGGPARTTSVALFRFGSTPDAKNSSLVVASASQSGLGLPDRDYYLKDDARSIEIRERYREHLGRMFELIGEPPDGAERAAASVLEMELRLARASMTREQLRDPHATYNRKTRDELRSMAKTFSWDRYFTSLGVPEVEHVVIGQPEFFAEVDEMMRAVSLELWRDYLRWNVIRQRAPHLSSDFETAHFEFYNAFLEGRKELLPRWRRCIASMDQSIGEALGQLYVEHAFPPGARSEALELVNDIVEALREEIGDLDWMSTETKGRALEKLAAFSTKIGHTEKWRDYSSLDVGRVAYVNNLVAARAFNHRFNLSRIGKPVDRTEWFMTPSTVNAYHNSLGVEIVFPAGILQHPFFDPNADAAYNYGGIGAVIGHELIHGFDDRGRQYGPSGNLTDWWSPEDERRFKERAACVVEQFESYDLGLEDLRMRGHLVLGESIADLGGLRIALRAYQRHLERHPRTMAGGFTPEQRFFLGYARIWARNTTPEAERLRVMTDPHPLAPFRVKGPLSNMPEFAAAFGCSAGSPMVRPVERQCRIW
ncbi:MAG TPA: M13 family metallopeptidase [Thermoanaerobaculia bacterium]|nr:M13 family metallopeptidase [Thermoanaerobaculia bacterium]